MISSARSSVPGHKDQASRRASRPPGSKDDEPTVPARVALMSPRGAVSCFPVFACRWVAGWVVGWAAVTSQWVRWAALIDLPESPLTIGSHRWPAGWCQWLAGRGDEWLRVECELGGGCGTV